MGHSGDKSRPLLSWFSATAFEALIMHSFFETNAPHKQLAHNPRHDFPMLLDMSDWLTRQ
jgi:hypothetical protein